MTDGPNRVEIAPAAQRELCRLRPGDAARLRGPILGLATEPFPSGVTKLAGTPFWRIRVGDLRVVYVVDEAAHRVVVLRVARRSESTYRGLRQRVEDGRIVIEVIPGGHRRSLAGSLRDKVGRMPDDESWDALRQAAWETPDPDRPT